MNWGNKLLLTFVAFGTMIGYLVYRAVNTNFELVEKDYYKSELRYQQVIDASNRSNELSAAPLLEQREDAVYLELPPEMKNKNVEGDIWFYCAYDSKKDKKFDLKTNNEAVQSFDRSLLQAGRYTVKINWSSDNKTYYSEKTLDIR
jgi:hypothetical protein